MSDLTITPLLLSELIGLIYETASDSSLWPKLLDGMGKYLESSAIQGNAISGPVSDASAGLLNRSSIQEAEQALLACLAPHFSRAQELHRQLHEAEDERDTMEGILDRLPIGIAIVDQHGSVISVNRTLLSVIRGGRHLRLEAGRLVSVPPAQLQDAIDKVLSQREGEYPLRLDEERGGSSVSLLISRQRGTKFAVVMVASQKSNALSDSGLCAFFNLTPAESRFTQQLALGLTVEEAALVLQIKLSTGRTHMKNVMRKVGVRRQPDLLRAVYSSPLWLEPVTGAAQSVTGIETIISSFEAAVTDRRFELGAGRGITYSDSGDPNGLPVFLMHCIGGSRRMRHPDDAILGSLGIRLIVPDRPGSGDSEPKSDRGIMDWPTDIASLADHLGLSQFGVLGFCGGTPYALAVASALPQRVSALFIVGGLPPLQQPLDARNLSNAFGASLLVAKYTPSLVPSMARLVMKGIRKNAYRCVERILCDEPEADRRAFADPKLRASFAASLLSAARWGEEGLIPEVLLFAQDWGFALESVRVRTKFWHGAMDASVNIAAVQKLGRAMPNASVTVVPDAGHYLLFSHWREIWREIRVSETESGAQWHGSAS